MLSLVYWSIDVMELSLIFLAFPSCLLPHGCKVDAASPVTTSAFKTGGKNWDDVKKTKNFQNSPL